MSGSITTAQDLILFAQKAAGVVGVGQTALDEDNTDCFNALNMMIGIWNRKRWLIWHLLDVGVVSTGSLFYTVGPGFQFDIPRPDRIEAGYFRQLVPGVPSTLTVDPALGLGILIDAPVPLPLGTDGPQPQVGLAIDFPLTILESKEDYSRIALKSLSTFPRYIFYDSAYPTGNVYTWPVLPAGIFELHILVKDVLTQFATLTTPINLPPEYYEALWSNLSLRLRTIYKIPAPPPGQDDVKDLAKASLDTIRGANTQIPRLMMPRSVIQNRRFGYNIYAGNTW
jgi:hypothetical protein